MHSSLNGFPSPLASRHASLIPRWHKSVRNNPINIIYIYKYVAGESGDVLFGNNIRPFKYIRVGDGCDDGVGFIDMAQIKKKRIVRMWGGTTLFFKKEIIL